MTVEKNKKSDREVWHRYIAGSDSSLSELVNKYHNRLLGFLTARGCADPEGICQDVWAKVISKKDSFDGDSFSGWVFMIAKNMLYGQHRKIMSRGESNISPEYDVACDDDIVGLVKMEQQEMIATLKQCIDTVGEPFVSTFRMSLDGETAKVIAKKIGIAENTVYTRVNRAKTAVADCVKGKLS